EVHPPPAGRAVPAGHPGGPEGPLRDGQQAPWERSRRAIWWRTGRRSPALAGRLAKALRAPLAMWRPPVPAAPPRAPSSNHRLPDRADGPHTRVGPYRVSRRPHSPTQKVAGRDGRALPAPEGRAGNTLFSRLWRSVVLPLQKTGIIVGM